MLYQGYNACAVFCRDGTPVWRFCMGDCWIFGPTGKCIFHFPTCRQAIRQYYTLAKSFAEAGYKVVAGYNPDLDSNNFPFLEYEKVFQEELTGAPRQY